MLDTFFEPLPVDAPIASVSLPVDAQAQPATDCIAALQGLRTLIVDDHEINRRIVREQAIGWGMTAVTFASAR